MNSGNRIVAKGQVTFTYIGGPTAMIEFGGLRYLTDPGFDRAGEEYRTPVYTIRKTAGPAQNPESLGRIDAVLLSHDHHFDNLDRAGRLVLKEVGKVITTRAGAERLGGNTIGLEPWQEVKLQAPSGGVMTVTATPARHGPAGVDRGPVIGFVLSPDEDPGQALYVSGDTVWYEGVEEVARRFPVKIAVLFMGAARVPEVGPDHLTFTAEEGVLAARAFKHASIVPLHYEGWAHFSESRSDIERVFAVAGIPHLLTWLEPGLPISVQMRS